MQKLLEQLNLVLKEQLTGVNINEKSTKRWSQYLIHPNFNRVNKLLVSSFEDEDKEQGTKDIIIRL